MTQMQKLKATLAGLYVVAAIGSVLYVHSIIKVDTVDSQEKSEKKTAKEIHPADVTLQVTYANTAKEYKVRLRNVDTVLDLLEQVRLKEGLKYEKTAYNYGVELSSVAGIKATETQKWFVYKDGQDITFAIAEMELIDGGIYDLKLVVTP